ncbi:PREDICTED: uncharacterized protein LOC109209921 [Nicotiana attenuata]|uniref:uncharacterized protein LOC109209921 n=1 Tax=Nicotiana attenuata TaxID=49451 RepID=UPI000904D1D1|nr:PREDICTED: uncharacterized protein LOC109209921 [Nicotiana attenuata]
MVNSDKAFEDCDVSMLCRIDLTPKCRGHVKKKNCRRGRDGLMEDEDKDEHPSSAHRRDLAPSDGASNACASGLGLVLEVPTGQVVHQSIRCPDMTNTEAEYEAVIAGFRLEYGMRRLRLYCDSHLVINQVTGTFQIKEQRLQKYQIEICKLLPKFDECQLDQISRTKNVEADDLAKLATAKKT